jgi:hypothetical protein
VQIADERMRPIVEEFSTAWRQLLAARTFHFGTSPELAALIDNAIPWGDHPWDVFAENLADEHEESFEQTLANILWIDRGWYDACENAGAKIVGEEDSDLRRAMVEFIEDRVPSPTKLVDFVLDAIGFPPHDGVDPETGSPVGPSGKYREWFHQTQFDRSLVHSQ